MNKTRLIWGIICLLIAVGLAVANLRLPPENLMFTVGNQNMPWVPVVIVGIVGIVLLATAWTGQEEVKEKPKIVEDPERAALNKRLETIAWGAFLILLGGFMFVPEEIIKGGWWSIGVGLIMLGLNAARYVNGLRMSGLEASRTFSASPTTKRLPTGLPSLPSRAISMATPTTALRTPPGMVSDNRASFWRETYSVSSLS